MTTTDRAPVSTTADEPKPCPFCGNAPFIIDRGPLGGGWAIACGCIPSPSLCDRRREVAVELWNQRSPDVAALLADVERLTAALREIETATGAYSRDPLTHAGNVIDRHVALAREALEPLSNTEQLAAAERPNA